MGQADRLKNLYMLSELTKALRHAPPSDRRRARALGANDRPDVAEAGQIVAVKPWPGRPPRAHGILSPPKITVKSARGRSRR
jgi:hypothetical protein